MFRQAVSDNPVKDHRAQAITSSRIDLLLFTPELLALSLENDRRALEKSLQIRIPENWFVEKEIIRFRLHQLMDDPDYLPWSLRAISLREEREMVGFINCHAKPADPCLGSIAPQGVEYGFKIFPRFRRRGHALEACQAFMKWAHDNHRVPQFVLSISPKNVPSLELARRLGFARVGSHVDETDGLEYEYRFDCPPAIPG